jgi:hypothetical protein
MKRFQNRLDTLLEDEVGISPPPGQEQSAEQSVSQVANDLIEIACQLQDTISTHKRGLQDAEIQLQNLVEQLNTKLGWEIRRRQPKLMIAHKGGTCCAGYYSNNIHFKPDLQTKSWSVDGPQAGMFKREFEGSLPLNNDLGGLADAVVKFFRQRYKTLQQG